MKAAASTKPNAAASADAGAFFSKTAKGHARVTPWIELLRGLLLRTGRALDEAEIALDGSAAHALQVLAECFCRRRWEEAIGAAVHARRVVVLRADVSRTIIAGDLGCILPRVPAIIVRTGKPFRTGPRTPSG